MSIRTRTRPGLKLRVLALPSQTTLLFGVVIGVMLVAVAASGLPSSPLHASPSLGLILAVLTLRDFLMQPEREIRTHGLDSSRLDEYPRLMAMVLNQAKALGMGEAAVPRPMIALKTMGTLFAFGSFRRHYLAFGETIARQIERDLSSPLAAVRSRAEAAILHEMQHLSQGDVIIVGLTRSLLKVGVLLMSWSGAFLLGLATVVFAFPLSDLFQPEFTSRLQAINPQLGFIVARFLTPDLVGRAAQVPTWGLAGLYVLNAHLPILVSGAVLYALIWRRLLKVREFYADTATATAQGQTAGIQSALLRYGTTALLHPVSHPVASVENAWKRFRTLLSLRVMEVASGWRAGMARVFDPHPSFDVRQKGLENPVKVLGDPAWVGVTAGALVLLLDLLLIGPFTLLYVSEAPGTVAALVGFAVISLGLLPRLVDDGRENLHWTKTMLPGVGLVLLIRMGFHFLNLGLLWAGVFIAPENTAIILNEFALTAAGVLRGGVQVVGTGDLVELAVEGTAFAVYLTILIGATLTATLLLDWQLKRLTLTWYSMPEARRRLIRVWWLASAGIALGVAGVWLPLINAMVPLSTARGFPTAKVVLIVTSLILLVSGGWWWMRRHRRYSRRCPGCGGVVPGWFYPGRQCEACGEVLHEWLQTRY